jgi:preprotein translocase subunit SecD
VRTDCTDPTQLDCGPDATEESAVPDPTTSLPVDGTATAPAPTAEPTAAPTGPMYHTVMTGAALDSAVVSIDQIGEVVIQFTLKPAASQLFADYTSGAVGQVLAIVLDKEVISAPQVDSPITSGQGIISGSFTQESANRLALQLRYGALPVPLKVVESREVGPSLGQDSLSKSLLAGMIGLSVVIVFMALYYRLPGVVADLAILFYALVTLALFKSVPVTLTLSGIAGFMLSTGSALDANILIFERLKEELRNGRSLLTALDPAWRRAWPSIRDSNIATIIICVILFWFGSAFGASVVKGFALTLFIGVLISLFTALVVTRSLLTAAVRAFPAAGERVEQWFGV